MYGYEVIQFHKTYPFHIKSIYAHACTQRDIFDTSEHILNRKKTTKKMFWEKFSTHKYNKNNFNLVLNKYGNNFLKNHGCL